MIRGLRGGSSPSTICRSVRQTPQASTRNRMWPGLGSGVGTSSIFSGDCEIGEGVVRTAAFMEIPFYAHRAAAVLCGGGETLRKKRQRDVPRASLGAAG